MSVNKGDKPPALHNEKRFVFQSNLNRLLSETKRVPPSSTPCAKCEQRKRICICSTVNGAVGKAPVYELTELADTKIMLSELRDSLNDIDIEKWSYHTKIMDETSLVVKQIADITTVVNGRKEPGAELVTNAWVKLYEILEFYKVVETLIPRLAEDGGTINSFHLSECPGGFIAALNHAIKQRNSTANLSWQATSLNPYHEGNSHMECLAEDILYRDTVTNWLTGSDESGNINKTANIEYIWDRVSRASKFNKGRAPVLVDIVTADGSFCCQADPNNQETLTAPLKLSEVVCALGLMRVGAIFILKMFTLFEESSLSIFTILKMCFKTVEVYKPHLSKSNGSEVYVVCIGFNGITSVLLCALCKIIDEYTASKERRAIIPKEWVPSSFRAEFVDCAMMFAQIQCRSLRHCMGQYMQISDENQYFKRKREFAKQFLAQFPVNPIPSDCRLVKYISFSDTVITGKDTSSLYHVPKRHLPNLESRRVFAKRYEELQKGRQELYRTSRQKENTSQFIILSEEATCADFGRNTADLFAFAKTYRPAYPEFSLSPLSFDLDPSLIDDLRMDLKHQKYVKESWFVSAPLHAHHIRMSHFVCNDLLYDVMHIRLLCGQRIPVVTQMDVFLHDGACGEAMSDINILPNSCTVDLALVAKQFLDIKRYKSYTEITSNPSQQFPAISLMKRHNLPGYLIYSFCQNGTGESLIHFDSSYELQVILDSFVGEGTLKTTLGFNYDQLLSQQEGYKSLTTQLQDTTLKNSVDFIFCDCRRSSNFHREVLSEEFKLKHVLVAQLIQAFFCLSPGGDLVIALSTTITRFTICIITVLRVCFQDVYLYRPESVPPWTQRSYVICRKYSEGDNSYIRYYLQCLWDAICLHKKSGREVLQTLRPAHFTHLSRQLWEFNTGLLLSHFNDLEIHTKSEPVVRPREFYAMDFLKQHDLVDLLYPSAVIDALGSCRLLSLEQQQKCDSSVEPRGSEKRARTEDTEEHVDTPENSPSQDNSHSPIWSSDEE
ncbi:ribosomal RNA large subunit methyltransferase J domain containing protein [Babesia bovis T2Bo]|uniref:Cap-specific mRNA (nucleoside-2'-O-)-methyltransferase 2 n=1 Tax=Babesia bovis TaxID=5865 RepID=A7AWH9_BABBO|nr:ribosomal RNA large subunit methyltransferase J domain containing protein [Babesia bovis T2Bo]EDO05407.1 ribosomal RNA large subunit methyltransferase J domain containing protein [Babesia bovis T2Bo]|eukprot:XP_001608975.1 ribosomal RNA large subunit methyltransferase J domain containing protein [Babesia bovis T2Bo]